MIPSFFLPSMKVCKKAISALFLLSILLQLIFFTACSKSSSNTSSDNTTDNTINYHALYDNSSTIWGGLLDNNTIPRWSAEEVVALLDSPTNIDNVTGCGHRNYRSIGSGGGIMYPDGIERSSVTGYYRHGSRYYYNSDKYEIRLGYWNDWLDLSDDLKEALDNYTKTRNLSNIKQYQGYLELSDAELES